MFGLGAARLIQLGHIVAVLWVTLFLLGLLAVGLRWSFGMITVVLTGGLVYVIGRYTPMMAQIVAAYAIAWLLLLSGVRGILRRCASTPVTGKVSARVTGASAVSSGSCCGWRPRSGAVAVGGKMLVMPT